MERSDEKDCCSYEWFCQYGDIVSVKWYRTLEPLPNAAGTPAAMTEAFEGR